MIGRENGVKSCHHGHRLNDDGHSASRAQGGHANTTSTTKASYLHGSRVESARSLAGKSENPRVPEYLAYAVNKYLLEIAAMLRLADWMIVVNDDPPAEEAAAASMNSRNGQKFAGVWLSDRFIDRNDPSLDDYMRSQTLIHEVLHCHFEEAWTFMEDIFDNEFSRQVERLATHTFKNMMEVGIDQLAFSLADLLPSFVFPPEPTPETDAAV